MQAIGCNKFNNCYFVLALANQMIEMETELFLTHISILVSH